MSIECVLFDLDGTIYRGKEACPFASQTVLHLLQSGVKVGYLTNNSGVTPDMVSSKLTKMEIPCEPSWVFATGPAVVNVCRQRKYRSAIVIGEPPLLSLFAEAGIRLVDGDQTPDVVVVGICRNFDYEMLRIAARAIRGGATFIATNTDSTFPTEGGQIDPGNGSLVAAVATASGATPEVIGKPSTELLTWALRDMDVAAKNCLIVGDRMDTDIAAGRSAGCPTWLVLTGVEKSLPTGQAGGSDLSHLAAFLATGPRHAQVDDPGS